MPKKILVVDDSHRAVQLLLLYLEGGGHQVQSAESGEEALELCNKNDFDIVVTDFNRKPVSKNELLLAVGE